MSDETLQEVVNKEAAEHDDTHAASTKGELTGDASADERRAELRRRIEAGQQRNEERSLGDYAKQAADSATDFAREHPIAAITGAIAIGLAIGAMTRPGRRLVRRGGLLAALAGETALAYAGDMFDGAEDVARSGRDRAEDFGDRLGTRSRGLSRLARARAANMADEAGLKRRSLGRRVARSWRDIKH
jgi:ElaB/YqjD/DUF883 family membrane-anchored ribosome-binding protein